MKEIHSCSSRSNEPKRNHHFCDLHSNEFNRQLCACGSIGAAHTRTHSRINGLIAFHQLKLWIYECDNRIVCHQHHTHFDSFWMRVNPLKTGTIPAKTFILISYFLLWPLSWLHWAKSVKNCCSFLHSLMRSILVAHSNVTDALFHGGKCVWDIFIGHTMLIGPIWFGVKIASILLKMTAVTLNCIHFLHSRGKMHSASQFNCTQNGIQHRSTS